MPLWWDLQPVALCGLALLTGCSSSPLEAGQPVPVDTIEVRPTAFREEVVTISTLDAVAAVQLAAQAGGRILDLRIRQGVQVKPGQLLVVLDQAQSQAEVSSLRSARAKNRLSYESFDDLALVGAASALQRDELRQAPISATANLRAREADLAFRDLRSPIAGVIGDVTVKVGDGIRAGDPFTTVIRNGELTARIEVPARPCIRVGSGCRSLSGLSGPTRGCSMLQLRPVPGSPTEARVPLLRRTGIV